jgi:hypothetical protein
MYDTLFRKAIPMGRMRLGYDECFNSIASLLGDPISLADPERF